MKGKIMNCINYLDFFQSVINQKIKLSNGRDATIFASWKVGGQDFYIYGIAPPNNNFVADPETPGRKEKKCPEKK